MQIKSIGDKFAATATEKGTLTTDKSSQKSSQKILELVAAYEKITTQEVANKLGISRRTEAKAIAKMQSEGFIRHVGPDKGGHWVIIPIG